MIVPRPSLTFRVVASLLVLSTRALRWRIDVQGAGNVPADRGAVLVYNHHSYFDFVMVAWHVYRELDRPLRFLAKRELFASPWTRWVVRFVDAVPVDRQDGTTRAAALDAAVDALRDGHLVVVAPEQTISRSFELLPFKTGAVRMAQAAAVPIVPVVGWGTQRFATKGHRLRLATGLPVTVAYGAPIAAPADVDPRELTEHVRQQMTAMLDKVQRAYPDSPREGEDPWWLPQRLGGSAPTHDQVLAEHEARQRGWEPPEPRREAS